ncbi:Serine/threonine-protein kinase Nek2-like isoform X2 [Oopsacas minuta]|uniref:non-specific serine/threonine protein kinase n=1 Tax=Oopsacas minuta TaxID=111878 RepID=A0AAV7K788_9METZ|nr:Serine/threonine-protein kinase Nek2-like isoform X2 [Oopsacas minuta]
MELKDYEVLEQIGKGSFGVCKKIRRKTDSKILVWKELDYGLMSDNEKQMLVSEVNLLRELRHEHIVKYYQRIIDKNTLRLYIVMEYCSGGDLSSLIARQKPKRKPFEANLVMKWFQQLLQALQACHYRQKSDMAKVIHRDLKPGNVFLDSSLNIKLGDFGLARILAHNSSFATTFVGTPYYMSPELLNNEAYNEKSDIWALGCIIYELCVLSPPFTALNQSALFLKIKAGKYQPFSPKLYSQDLAIVINKMLQLSPCSRPDIAELISHRMFKVAEMEFGNHTRERTTTILSTRERELQAKEKELLSKWYIPI